MSQQAELVRFETECLSIACEVSGPAGGAPVFLLHGWPDDVRTWDRILPRLHAAGYQTRAPYLRGFGPTHFRDPVGPRTGQLSALGQDLLELADAMSCDRFTAIGHDWGARACYIASALAPQRVDSCVALSVGWGTNDQNWTPGLKQIQNYWYHWYMALDRGADLVHNDRIAFTRYIWRIWNPGWQPSDEEFDTTARSFLNRDRADVVLHSYRSRWGYAALDPHYASIDAKLAGGPKISVPTLVIHGGSDPCNDPSTSEGKEPFFTSGYSRLVLDGVGHFPQREAPDDVAIAITDFLNQTRPSL
jgi:pimeloyl-ACP methyl ester carboxylesterase